MKICLFYFKYLYHSVAAFAASHILLASIFHSVDQIFPHMNRKRSELPFIRNRESEPLEFLTYDRMSFYINTGTSNNLLSFTSANPPSHGFN